MNTTGRLCNWTKADYEADTSRERATRLKSLMAPQGPRNYFLNYVDPPPLLGDETENTSLRDGRLFHELLIEGKQDWAVTEMMRRLDSQDYQTLLAANDWELAFDETGDVYKSGPRKGKPKTTTRIVREGKPILTQAEHNRILAWRDGAMRNKKLREMIEGPRFVEQVILWEEDIDGFEIPCKASVDLWSATAMGDVKTTRHSDPTAYRRECFKLHYPLQAATYMRGRDAIPELRDIRCSFFHVVVCKERPYYSYVWELPAAWIRSANQDVQWCLELLAKCRKREAEGMDPLDAWPDFVERDESVLQPEPHMMEKRGMDPNQYDPVGEVA